MRKHLFGLVAVTAVFLGSSPALSQYAAYPDGREPAYVTTLYSDATLTTVVGYITPECGHSWVQYTLTGTYSYHNTNELVGYCTSYGMEPI